MTDLFSADFDSIAVGDAYESESCRIDARDVAVFGALTGDLHPAHVDPEWARQGPFGRPIAHGMLVLSCAVGALPLEPDRVLALRRVRDAVFKRPVAVGDAISVRCTVAGVRPLDEATGLVDCEWRILGSDRRLRARAVVEVLWAREKAPDGRDAPATDETAPVVVGAAGEVQVLV